MKSARAWPHAGLCQRTACGFWPVRRRGDVARRGAGRYQDGRVWRMTSSPIFRGMGTPCPANKPRTGTLPTRSLRRHKTGLSARQAGTRRWRGPYVAVRKTADGAHRPRRRPTPVRHASVDTATQRPAALQDDTRWDREETARQRENSQLADRFRRWWQVLGSNQRRLSRRFYRPLALPESPPLTSADVVRGPIAGRRCPLCVRAPGAGGRVTHGRVRTASAGDCTFNPPA